MLPGKEATFRHVEESVNNNQLEVIAQIKQQLSVTIHTAPAKLAEGCGPSGEVATNSGVEVPHKHYAIQLVALR